MLISWFLESFLPFKEINYDPKLWQSLIALPYTIFLDGNERFSYIGFEPKKIYNELPNSNALPKHEHYKELPPFQGGLIGFLSYELGHVLTLVILNWLNLKSLLAYMKMLLLLIINKKRLG